MSKDSATAGGAEGPGGVRGGVPSAECSSASAEWPLLLILSGPSGAGKTVLAQRLVAEYAPGLQRAVTYTTRPPRPGEVDGRDYHFVTERAFNDLVDAHAFVEDALVHGYYYATPWAPLRQREHDVLLILDWQGEQALSFQADDRHRVTVFIRPADPAQLGARLRGRATDPNIDQRLGDAAEFLGHESVYQHVIVNEDLEEAYRQLRSIYQDAKR